MYMWLIVLACAIGVLIDAKRIGVKKGLVTGMGNVGPWGWFALTLLLWIVGFPMYLYYRGKYKLAVAAASNAAGTPLSASTNVNSSESAAIRDLERFAALKEKGLITDDDFEAKKKQLLGLSQGVSSTAIPRTGSAPILNAGVSKCHQCGGEMPTTAKFCRFCGAKLNPASPTSSVARPSIAAPETSTVATQAAPVTPIRPSASTSTTSGPASSAPSSAKTAIYTVIGVLVIVVVGSVGYWGWTQKKVADEQAALVAKHQAEEQKHKADEEQQQKLKEAEERGRREAEGKATQEAADKPADIQTQSQPQPLPAVDNLLQRASNCATVLDCMSVMLDGVDPRRPDAIQLAAVRISDISKAQRGDRKIARDLNKKGLDEFRNNNLPGAIDLLKRAAAADPADVEIVSNLGYVALRANSTEVASQALSSALLLDARRTSSWVPIAELFTIKGTSDAAVRALLLGYEFSANKEKSMTFFEDKANTAEREAMRPIYVSAIQKIKARGNM